MLTKPYVTPLQWRISDRASGVRIPVIRLDNLFRSTISLLSCMPRSSFIHHTHRILSDWCERADWLKSANSALGDETHQDKTTEFEMFPVTSPHAVTGMDARHRTWADCSRYADHVQWNICRRQLQQLCSRVFDEWPAECYWTTERCGRKHLAGVSTLSPLSLGVSK